ncbi:hypothetical protein DFH27DRAFT_489227 [Peziza echinospora]|nr:hypothetical protein DFH27DRAFT_489227 [Peziza echinospora]
MNGFSQTESVTSELQPEECTTITMAPVQESPKNIDYFSGLPDEIKIKIFQQLPPKQLARVSIVSKRWYELCHDGQLWGTFDATDFYRDIPAESLAKIIQDAGPFVRHLNLRGCINLQHDPRIMAIATSCKNLLTANFEGCNFTREVIHTFAAANPGLLQLNISGQTSVTNTTCRLLALKCTRLESLDISWCPSVDSRGIKKIVEACPGLRELRVSEVRRIDEGSVMQAIFNANTLERLYLSCCSAITDDTIRLLVEGRHSEIDPLTNRTSAPPRRLKHLDLSQCSQLTSDALRHLAFNVPHLEGLLLSGCDGLTDDGFEILFPTVPKLSHLDLEECGQLTNDTLLALSKAPCAATLRHLQLSYCEQMGDAGLIPLVRACPNLMNLEMDNTRVGDATLLEISLQVRIRKEVPILPKASVGMRIVIYDTPGVTWRGVRDVLAKNTTPVSNRLGHGQVVQMKCYYGWQMTVDEHLKRVLRDDLRSAKRLENKWADFNTDPRLSVVPEGGEEGTGWCYS